MVWDGISMQDKTDLHVFHNGTVTGVRYRDENILPIVRPYAGASGDDFILMDYNAGPHRGRVADDYLQPESTGRIVWPSKSPDCNLIENDTDILGQAVQARINQPRNLRQLTAALQEEWARTTQ